MHISRPEVLFVPYGCIIFTLAQGEQTDQNHFLMDLEEELFKILVKTRSSVTPECSDANTTPLLPSGVTPIV